VTTAHTDWRLRSVLMATAVVAALLLAEIALRLAGIGYPVFSRPDDIRGWALRPGAHGRFIAEGGSLVAINRDGLRDREHSRRKTPGTLRIAVLGDSYTEAIEVPVEQTFWSVLEGELNRSGAAHGRRVEVLNFGVRGYGTAQELLTLRCCVWDYAPDVVLLAFYSGNDVSDNSRRLDRSPTRYARPYLEPTASSSPLDLSFRQGWRYRATKLVAPLVTRSRLLQLLIHAQYVVLRRPTGSRTATSAAGIGSEFGLDSRIYVEPDDEPWAAAWHTTEALLTTMAREVSDHGARFAVVCVTNPIQVYPDTAARERYAHELGVTDLLLPGRRVRALGERERFPVLDLAPDLQAYADRQHAFLHGFDSRSPGTGHWNQLGHRLAGQALASWMAGWIADPPLASSGARRAPDRVPSAGPSR
jgi:hypothetical protein